MREGLGGVGGRRGGALVPVVEIEAWLDEAAQNLVAVRSSWSMSRHYLGFTSAKAAFLLRVQRCAVVVNTSPGVHIS
jgi:hypothetical protein